MPSLDIVGLGLSTLDFLVRLKEMPTWDHGSSFSALKIEGGGPVATALVAAARLGARVGYVGAAGSDEFGLRKVDGLAQAGVDVTQVVQREHAERDLVMVYVNEQTGERHFSASRPFGNQPLTVGEVDRSYVASAQYLHLDGWYSEAAHQAALWMHEAGKTVVFDGGKTGGPLHQHTRDLMRLVDVLICGSGFSQALTGHADVKEAGKAALDLGPRIVVQTEGERGSYTTTASEQFHTPAFRVDVVDTTGAGDVFHGAYLVGLLKGWDVRTIAPFATAVSAIKCTRLGGRTGIPTFEETTAFLKDQKI